MDMAIQKADPWDIFLWPDDMHPAGATRCYREQYERGEYRHMSDDFRVIPHESDEWFEIEAGDGS